MHVSLDTGDVSGSRSTWGDEPGGSRGIPRSPSIEYYTWTTAREPREPEERRVESTR